MRSRIFFIVGIFVLFTTLLYAQVEQNVGINFFARVEIIDFFPSKNNTTDYSDGLKYLSTTGLEISVLAFSERLFPYLTFAYSSDFVKRNDQLSWGEGLSWSAGVGSYIIGSTQQEYGFGLIGSLGYSMKVLFQNYIVHNADDFYYRSEPFIPLGGEAALKASYTTHFAVFSIGFVFAFYRSDKMIGFSAYELNDGWALSYGINLSYGFNI